MGRINIRKFAFIAMLLACVTPQTRGNGVYLKQTGPSPLRFSLATASFSFVLPAMLRDQTAVTNSPEIAATSTNSATTNAVAAQISPAASSANNAPALTNPILPNNGPTTPSASDLLVVSPQMLTEFFKSGQNGTNSPGTVVAPAPVAPVAPVGFTPPSMTPSSQAIYKIQ